MLCLHWLCQVWGMSPQRVCLSAVVVFAFSKALVSCSCHFHTPAVIAASLHSTGLQAGFHRSGSLSNGGPWPQAPSTRVGRFSFAVFSYSLQHWRRCRSQPHWRRCRLGGDAAHEPSLTFQQRCLVQNTNNESLTAGIAIPPCEVYCTLVVSASPASPRSCRSQGKPRADGLCKRQICHCSFR